MQKIIIILLLTTSSIFSQNSIYVEYGVKINTIEGSFTTNETLRNALKYATENDESLLFALFISKKNSRFFNLKKLESDDNKMLDDLALTFSGYGGEVYDFEDSIYSEVFNFGQKLYQKKAKIDNWILINETKEIDGYLCYKATNINKVINSANTFNHPVTAWYCPKLPYNNGPNGYGNLPGLILELQVRNVVFGAKKIDTNSKFKFDFSFLKKAKTIIKEEIERIIEKEYSDKMPKK